MNPVRLVALGTITALVAVLLAALGGSASYAAPKVAGRLTITPAMAAPGTTVKVRGKIPPLVAHKVELQRRDAGKFVTIATKRTHKKGVFNFKTTLPDGRSNAFYRVFSPRTLDPATGKIKSYLTRTRTVTLTRSTTTRITRIGESQDPALSADGRYVTYGSAHDPGNGDVEVFVWDRVTGTTTRITDGSGGDPAISGDGRYVTYQSGRSSGRNSFVDVFVWDRVTGTTTLITGGNTFGTPHEEAFGANPAISGDGRYVTYGTDATNGLASDTNAGLDVFLWDRVDGTTTRITNGNSSSLGHAISPDGRYVTYNSLSTNLVPGDTNGRADVFVWDRITGTTTRITNGNDAFIPASLSADGSLIAYCAYTNGLVPGDTDRWDDVFVWDRTTGATTRITNGDSSSCSPAISADGSRVAFISHATSRGDTNGLSDVFVWDRTTGKTTRITNGDSGAGETEAAISADGNLVAYRSVSNNLVTGDHNRYNDVFVWDRGTG